MIEPILGSESMIGLVFQLFDGMWDLLQSKHTKEKGFIKIKHVEEKLLEMFEGDDRNPYFEALYMAQYNYYVDLASSA